VRNSGIGTALLKHSLDWARSAGYERCAVDFEPENISGARFWLRHFRPVCYSLVRHVDERVAWAHEKREDKDLW
jgi:GNAT superfamily N-acetyltransferase